MRDNRSVHTTQVLNQNMHRDMFIMKYVSKGNLSGYRNDLAVVDNEEDQQFLTHLTVQLEPSGRFPGSVNRIVGCCEGRVLLLGQRQQVTKKKSTGAETQ